MRKDSLIFPAVQMLKPQSPSVHIQGSSSTHDKKFCVHKCLCLILLAIATASGRVLPTTPNTFSQEMLKISSPHLYCTVLFSDCLFQGSKLSQHLVQLNHPRPLPISVPVLVMFWFSIEIIIETGTNFPWKLLLLSFWFFLTTFLESAQHFCDFDANWTHGKLITSPNF